MPTREILNSHSVTDLKKEIAKTNIKGYSKMKKPEIVSLMLKHKDRFSHIKHKEKVKKPAKKPRQESEAYKKYKKTMTKMIPGIRINADRDMPDMDDIRVVRKMKKDFEKQLKQTDADDVDKVAELRKRIANTDKRIEFIKNAFPKFRPDENSLKDMKKWLKIHKWKLANKYGNKNELNRAIGNIERHIKTLK